EIRLLGRFCHVQPIIAMKKPLHYRNKVQAAFASSRSGAVISGVYQSGSHRIVPVDSCMIEDELADRIIVTVRGMLRSFKISPYNELTGRGFLRHVLVKRGFATGQVMVVLVTAAEAFPSKRNFLRVLLEKHPEITTVVQNINSADTNLVLGRRQKVLWGSGYIEDELCDCRFRISPRSFYQINPVQTQVLYDKAMEYAALTGRERVIDAYCGIGTIGIVAAKRGAAEVIGVELNPDAVRDARGNAKLNGLENIRFYTDDAGDFMVDFAAQGQKCDVLFMDPPRAGSSEAFLSSALRLAPKRIVYISCNPETLARDLKYLTAKGEYRADAIQPVDMFPFTEHVETIVLLSHQKKDPYEPKDAEYLKQRKKN
ncbi:MAG: 23S rRNA (uracil(1939)-C(5))-methyltransferase RlmD, partial [Oscillospiraceae bacterium]|nr:23S rRNA (uracil(1939)-C(5))-methyltransferase RlmD [Oscillospiraceae bacterium]